MRKTAIDKELPKIYSSLLDTSRRMCWKYRRTYSPEEVVNISYLYIIQIKEKVSGKDMLRRYMTAKICQEIALTNSETNRKLISRHCELIENQEIEDEPYFDPYEDELKSLTIYREVPDRVKRRVFEVYFDKEQNTCRKMAEYFNIDTRSAMNLIREMKKDLQQINDF